MIRRGSDSLTARTVRGGGEKTAGKARGSVKQVRAAHCSLRSLSVKETGFRSSSGVGALRK